MKLGAESIDNFKSGGSQVSKLYQGAVKVWPATLIECTSRILLFQHNVIVKDDLGAANLLDGNIHNLTVGQFGVVHGGGLSLSNEGILGTSHSLNAPSGGLLEIDEALDHMNSRDIWEVWYSSSINRYVVNQFK